MACAIVTAALWLVAPDAMATGGGYTSCKATPSIRVTADENGVPTPCPVVPNGLGGWRCAGTREDATKTGIRYENFTSGDLNHVAVLVTANNDVLVPSSTQVIKNCDGDPVTGLGKRACHENAVKLNGVPRLGKVWVVVDGAIKTALPTTIATKPTPNSNTVKCFSILGLGLDSAPVAGVTETLSHRDPVTGKLCSVEFTLDSAGANVLAAKLTPDSDPDCDLRVDKVEDVEITIGGQPHKLKFGQGYLQSGLNSCTTRVIGGRVYSWGSPCPE
jgi:hypothetical protein